VSNLEDFAHASRWRFVPICPSQIYGADNLAFFGLQLESLTEGGGSYFLGSKPDRRQMLDGLQHKGIRTRKHVVDAGKKTASSILWRRNTLVSEDDKPSGWELIILKPCSQRMFKCDLVRPSSLDMMSWC
jgi:hypothetical protein